MDARELIEMADQLILVCAGLVEDLHAELVVSGDALEIVRAKAGTLGTSVDRFRALAGCASILLDIAADQDVPA